MPLIGGPSSVFLSTAFFAGPVVGVGSVFSWADLMGAARAGDAAKSSVARNAVKRRIGVIVPILDRAR